VFIVFNDQDFFCHVALCAHGCAVLYGVKTRTPIQARWNMK
jgi:hypothetical protein